MATHELATIHDDADLTNYERLALRNAAWWLGRSAGFGDRALGGAFAKTRWLLDRALDNERVRERIEATTDEVIVRLGDVLTADDANAVPPTPTADPVVRATTLRRTDRAAGRLHAGCVGAMTVEGFAAGAASMTPVTALLTLLPDLAAALTISTSSAARMLTLYGVTERGPAALEAAVQVAAIATETDPGVRRTQFLGLADRLTTHDRGGASPEEISQLVAQQMAVRAVRETVEQTVRRTARRRLAAFVPILGIAVHAVASGWLGGQVCEGSRHLGRVIYLSRSTGWPTTDLLVPRRG